ncbi:MAG TPA: alpha/beta hydrolase family protein [Polyangiaceae bacterium]|jgi:S-formylglutathione hydrolase FrmB|nr:alpha/beta hydrolase family protein [Polyangiaceae bacterium]
MALIDCKFFSDTLGMSSSMLVILPEQTQGQIGLTGQTRSSDGRYPTLFLLHGLSDDETIWLRRTSIERYVAPLGLAVVMPNVHRSFYVNMAHGPRYWDFVSDELVRKARGFFPLSSRRDDTFVAGLSMGGYGSLLLGLRKPEQFAAAASLSGACEAGQVPERAGAEHDLVFGRENQVRGSELDPRHLASELAASDRPRPKLYQCCGTSDFLYAENVRFRDHVRALPFDHTYEEGPGEHEWGYWDTMIQRVLRWLPLPATRK